MNSETQNYFPSMEKMKQSLNREELPDFSFHVALWVSGSSRFRLHRDYCHLGWLAVLHLRYPSQETLQMALKNAKRTVGPKGPDSIRNHLFLYSNSTNTCQRIWTRCRILFSKMGPGAECFALRDEKKIQIWHPPGTPFCAGNEGI